jgi:hypothetical protein
MSKEEAIERRLTALEQAVAELQQRLNKVQPPANWLERFRGAFKDVPAFDEVVKYGREIREADRPAEDSGP